MTFIKPDYKDMIFILVPRLEFRCTFGLMDSHTFVRRFPSVEEATGLYEQQIEASHEVREGYSRIQTFDEGASKG